MALASVQISFGAATSSAAAGAHLSAEIDGRASGWNGGRTSFTPGAAAWFLVFKSAGVTYSRPVPSAGVIEGGQAVSVSRTEDLTFAGTNAASLSVPAQSIASIVWLGRSLGDLALGDDGMSITAAASGVAIARVTYTAAAEAWRLTSPASVTGLTDFPVLVYILGAAP